MKYKLDHVGYLTGCIPETAKAFESLGYVAGDIINDDHQQTKICFLRKENETNIELVEPYEDNKTMQKMFAKRGVTPYHVCYEVDDIDAEYDNMIANNWTALFKPVEAPAFDNRKICYFWNSEIGFVELVNK
jgi:methylmalonyl-CoA/ethylmalonyl-CoA epimerase